MSTSAWSAAEYAYDNLVLNYSYGTYSPRRTRTALTVYIRRAVACFAFLAWEALLTSADEVDFLWSCVLLRDRATPMLTVA
jgi:hypothetical protein